MANDPPTDAPGQQPIDFPATLQLRKGPQADAPASSDSVETHDDPRLAWVGDYELLAEIARGGMGIVYKARQRKLNRMVALKVTRAGQMITPEEAWRFHIEATAAAKLDHPHIVPIYEVGEAGGQHFFSMALVEGESLGQALAAGPLPPRQAAELVRQVAQAVAYAHAQGVIHRDLKPSNILVDAAGQPRITDFGLAKCAGFDSGMTQAGEVMGTPSFMAPEQAEGKVEFVGPLADVYALGATLYCLVTGRPPFQAASPLETLRQVAEREPVPPRQLNQAVDRDLDTICLKCLQKRPERRYASAAALAEDLQRFLDQRPILARPVGQLEKLARWCRRNPLVAGSLAGVVGIFLTAFLLVSWNYWRAEEARAEAQRKEQAERWERYRANIAAGASALQLNNVGAARRVLDDAPREHRQWEWRHLSQQLDLSQDVLGGQERCSEATITLDGAHVLLGLEDFRTQVWDTARRCLVGQNHSPRWKAHQLSPDGRHFAYAPIGTTIEIREVATDKVRLVLTGHTDQVDSIRFTPDSAKMISGSDDGMARVWDLRTGQELQVFREHVPMGASASILALSPDSRLVASVGRGESTCLIWDVSTGQVQARLPGHKGIDLAGFFSPGGERFLTIEAYPTNTLRLWDLATGRLLTEMAGHTNKVTSVVFSPDGKTLATSSMDQTVRLWDAACLPGSGFGKPIAVLRGHTGWVNTVRYSPDGHHLLTASQDQTVRLWDAVRGMPLAVLRGHTGAVDHAAYVAGGSTIVSAAHDGTVRFWDARMVGKYGILRGHTNFLYGVAFHPDGNRLASASWDGSVRCWDEATGRQLWKVEHENKAIVTSVAFHPCGRFLASLGRDNAVRLWDVASSRPVLQLSIPSADWQDSRLAISPKGDRLAAGNFRGDVYLWNLTLPKPGRAEWPEQPAPRVRREHVGPVRDVAFSPDGRRLASASIDGTVAIWDPETMERLRVLEGHENWVYALAWSADGKWLASGATDSTVRLWDTATWRQSDVLRHGGSNVYGVAFTPDGTRLACACADNTIRLWDVARGQEVVELRGHEAYVHAVVFSPDGTRLASASGDFTVRVWDSRSVKERWEGLPGRARP